VIWLALGSMTLAMGAIAAWSLPGPALLEGPSWGPEVDPSPPLALLGLAMFGVAEAASLTAMAIRLRRVTGAERQQIKWFLYAGSFVILGITVEILLGVPITIASWLGGMVVPFAIAVAVALFKYRLYDIDRIINRTLVYGLLTALLAGVYAIAVLVLGQVFGGVGGDPPTWAVAGATLAVAALFQPARRSIQAAVDRRFNRRKYDAAKTVEAFSLRLREEVDLDALSGELLGVVDQTMQPTTATLWLRTSARGGYAKQGSPHRPGPAMLLLEVAHA
jgi:hypothetical protein